jgi:hypothetical protein
MDPETIAYLDRKFDALGAHLELVETRLNVRLDRIEARLDSLEARQDRLEARQEAGSTSGQP